MRTISLGNSGVDVSRYCLGAMYIGTQNDAASSYRLLDMYVAAGGTPTCTPGRAPALTHRWRPTST